jgi:hypothetical protein
LGGKLGQNRSYLDDDGLRKSMKPDMWRTWSNQRAGYSSADFEGSFFIFYFFLYIYNAKSRWHHGLKIGLTDLSPLIQCTAAEIGFNETRVGGPMDGLGDEILELGGVASDPINTRKELSSFHEIDHNEIRTRLQGLELELSSVLRLLRSNASQIMSQKVGDNNVSLFN